MAKQLEILFELQALDSRLLEKRKIVEKYEAELAAQRALIQDCTARIEAAQAQRKDAVVERALAERKVSDLQEALKNKRQRAQKARNERELRAGQEEIASALEEIREAETVLLELMGKVEEMEAAIEALRRERVELESADHRHVEEAAERIDALRAQLAAEVVDRDRAAAAVDATIRKKYEMLLTRRAGLAVVEVDAAGCCAGCHVQIPPQNLLEIRRTGVLRVCPMCNRILYLPDAGIGQGEAKEQAS